jgi:cyclic-di-AMP phosphodiesterase PgpH
MGKSSKASRTTRRREELRKAVPRPVLNLRGLLQRPEFVNTALVLAGFIAVSSAAIAWSREQPKVRDNQIMTTTSLKRLTYQVVDEQATSEKREEARKSSPRVYRLNDSYLKRIEAALLGLPKAVAGKEALDDISRELRKEFDLDTAALQALQPMLENDEPSRDWVTWVSMLVREQLVHNPLLRTQEYGVYSTTLNKALILPDGTREEPLGGMAIEIANDPAQTDARLRDMIERTGFPPALQKVVVGRLTFDPQPTFTFDEAQTKALADAAAARVAPEVIRHARGDVLYRRGDRLTREQVDEVFTEAERYRSEGPIAARWLPWAGIAGLVAVVAVFVGSFAAIAYPRILRNPLRLAAICALIISMLAIAVVITVNAPIFYLPAAIGPALLTTILLLVAYDQRLALLLAGIQCMLVTLALEQSIGFFILLLAGCATTAAQLREVRHRNSLLHAATMTAAVLGVGTMLLGMLELPMIPSATQQVLVMALSAALTSYGVSFLVLGILPSVERIFDITTGMTLAELRDPKRPLLRQLQQRAPGTYNHSLQVASIAEAAAEAVGADSLLTYVGALYHDVGKINKPEYFVENQAGGINKHDKLSPAMSLLVIIGHVKNGVELAREYGVPRSIQHFIESHHGTTLVEYFYHAARTRAESKEESVADVEYRYPGPKPRTKEAAILMLADAVESTSRALAEPNPSRIETLVRKLAAKRLDDGQFDECDLTFRELAVIEDAMINRLQAIYHSRISYPSSRMDDEDHPGVTRPIPASRPASA